MYENYANVYPPIDLSVFDQKAPTRFFTSEVVATPQTGFFWSNGVSGFLFPLQYTDWRDEALSWHLTCSIHSGLSPSPVTVIRGPGAIDFMRDNFVNNVDKWDIGRQKHGITLTEDGLVATHGIIMRTGEQEYEAWWHAPYIDYLFSLKNYDAELIDASGKSFTFQLSGPKSEMILEEVTGESLADIKYLYFRGSSIAGKRVRILRFGMTGNLSFEVHGRVEDAQEIYKTIVEAGTKHGIRELGYISYNMNHNEGGYPNAAGHFAPATLCDEGFLAWMDKSGIDPSLTNEAIMGGNDLCGSIGTNDIHDYLFNPIELGLGYCVHYGHEFRGKDALLAYKNKEKKRNITTLEWNIDDVMEVIRSQYDKDEEAYAPIEDYAFSPAKYAPNRNVPAIKMTLDKVFDKDGKEIGYSMFKTHSPFYKCVLTLAVLDADQREIGNEVYILHGDPGTRQKRIRATVEAFPYNQHHERKGISL